MSHDFRTYHQGTRQTYNGQVVKSQYYDAAEVCFEYAGRERNILIESPAGYYKQHSLIGKRVTFTIEVSPHGPGIIADIGFAVITRS